MTRRRCWHCSPGAERVTAAVLEGALISAVNLAEVIAKLSDYDMPGEEIRQVLSSLDLEILPFDEAQAYEAGLLRSATRARGLSLGDRACLALARRRKLPALTADATWSELLPEPTVVVLR